MKKYFIRYKIVFFILFYFGCDNSGPKYIVDTSPVPQVALSASTDSIFVAGNVSLNVNVEDLEDIFGISFEILYDTTYLEVGLDAGFSNYSDSFTGETYGPVIYSDTLGVVSFAMKGSDIDGLIYTVTFTGKEAGTGYIVLSEEKVKLIKNDGTDIPNFSSFTLPDTVKIVISNTD